MAAKRKTRVATAGRKRPLATFTLSPEAAEMIADLASDLGLSKSAVVELAVRKLARSERR